MAESVRYCYLTFSRYVDEYNVPTSRQYRLVSRYYTLLLPVICLCVATRGRPLVTYSALFVAYHPSSMMICSREASTASEPSALIHQLPRVIRVLADASRRHSQSLPVNRQLPYISTLNSSHICRQASVRSRASARESRPNRLFCMDSCETR